MMIGYCLSLCVYQIGSTIAGSGFTFGTFVAIVLAVVAAYFIFRKNPYAKRKGNNISAVEANA